MTPGEFIAAFDVIAEAPGGVERLRALVLQLAVRGRLVPQDAGDESASVLLERIADEKARRSHQIRTRKPLPTIKDAEFPFGIPVSWEWTHLGEITSYGTTKKAEPSEVSKETWVLELEDIEKVSSRLLNRVRYGMRPFKSAKNRFYKGDVLYGKLRPYLDKVIIANEDGVCTSEIMPIRGFVGLTPQFIRLVLKSPYFVQYANSSTHGMNLPRLGTDKARQALFPLPPEAEQHRIVAKVDELMGLIDRLEAARSSREAARIAGRDSALATLRNAATPKEVSAAWMCIAERMDDLFTDPADLVPLREAVLQLAVRGRLVEQDSGDEPAGRLLELIVAEKAELVKKKKVRKRKSYGPLMSAEIPFEIPRSWTWVRLHDLAHDLGQKVPDKTFSYIDVSAIDNKRGAIISAVPILDPSEAPSRARKLVRLESVIYSTVRPYLLNIAVVDCEYSPTPIASTAFAVLHPHSGVHSRLLFFYLRAPFFVDFVTAQMKGVAYPAINDTDLLRAPVPLPPTAEQHRIVAKVDELMGLIDQLEQHLVDKRKHHDASAVAATNVV